MPIYFGNNFAKEPFQFDSIGNNWEQESVNRPNGFPLFHYLQTQKGTGIINIYYKDELSSDHKISQTIELSKGQGILIAPYIPHSYHNKNAPLHSWQTEFATFTGSMEPAFKDIFTENGYWIIDEYKGKEISAAISRAMQHFKERGNDTRTLSVDCYNIMLLLADQTNHSHGKDDPVFSKFIKPVIDTIEDHYMEDISAQQLANSVFVSQQYLSRIFSEFLNCSVYEYLTNYRINKAKELLLLNQWYLDSDS